MTDPLSVAASALAIVGAADIVLRAGKELYGFLSDIKDAPENVKRLRNYIQDISRLIKSAKDFWEEQKRLAPPRATLSASLSSASSHFEAVLRALNDELSCLVNLAKKHDGVAKPGGKIKWVFERKIKYSVERLDRSKLSLVAALNIVGR